MVNTTDFWEDVSFWSEILSTIPIGLERHQRFLVYSEAKKSGLSHSDARIKALKLSPKKLPKIIFKVK